MVLKTIKLICTMLLKIKMLLSKKRYFIFIGTIFEVKTEIKYKIYYEIYKTCDSSSKVKLRE